MQQPLPQLNPNVPDDASKLSSVAILLQDRPSNPPVCAGVYLHIPFCFHKCHYCDFYSIVEDDEARQSDFTDRLIQELRLRASQFRLRPRAIFAGGGTPTYLKPHLWDRLLAAMHALLPMHGVREFTVEANPETVTPELMQRLVAAGVNRVSIGAQSFHPHLLKTLERWHDPAAVPKAVQLIREAGISNINLDLIFAIPGQTLDTLRADLDAALALEPQHLSCYGLTYEPNTAMTQRLKMGQVDATDEETERQMYALVLGTLDAAGFEQYEVSNWARRGTDDRRCQHNLLYWHNENWIGIGAAAASHVDGHRWKNQPHLGKYLASGSVSTDDPGEPPITDYEHLPEARRLGEQLMLGLRLREGIAEDWLEAHLPLRDARRGMIVELKQIGMLESVAGRLRLTQRGLFVADAVIARLL